MLSLTTFIYFGGQKNTRFHKSLKKRVPMVTVFLLSSPSAPTCMNSCCRESGKVKWNYQFPTPVPPQSGHEMRPVPSFQSLESSVNPFQRPPQRSQAAPPPAASIGYHPFPWHLGHVILPEPPHRLHTLLFCEA